MRNSVEGGTILNVLVYPYLAAHTLFRRQNRFGCFDDTRYYFWLIYQPTANAFLNRPALRASRALGPCNAEVSHNIPATIQVDSIDPGRDQFSSSSKFHRIRGGELSDECMLSAITCWFPLQWVSCEIGVSGDVRANELVSEHHRYKSNICSIFSNQKAERKLAVPAHCLSMISSIIEHK